ncbi:MAG: SIMPL domain-containing protein [Candidatus Magasanikbacteria bacterium]|nr:SIMPL domain-containing protein [Candidatus Magasanikbacteria bacterium]
MHIFCHGNQKKDEKGCCCRCSGFGPILMKVLAGILLVYLIIFIGALARNNLKKFNYIGKAERMQNTIALTGEGKVTGAPNIAVTEIGLLTEKEDVASAQKENTEKMNKLISEVKKLGIAVDDIQTTQYQIYPKYDYSNGKSVISGYTVSQSVSIKIRDLAKINAVLAKVGEVGVNQVSNLSFTIDNPEELKAAAREKALTNVKAKAVALAKDLGVKLVRIVSFNEYAPENQAYPMYKNMAEGMGGAGATPSPDIQTGTLEVKVSVSVIYEIE